MQASCDLHFIERPRVAHAPRVTVGESRDFLDITIRWFGFDSAMFAVMCALWDAGVVAFIAAACFTGMSMMWVVVIPQLAIALFLTYYALCGLLNRTLIRVGDGTLTVSHGPLPWPGGRELPTRDLSQIFVRENFRKRNAYHQPHHDVCALLSDGRVVALLPLLTDVRQALFIEQALERHLQIADCHVPGEIAR